MRARFTNAIASTEGWSYPSGREVTLAEQFSRDTVPARIAEPWLASGLLEPIADTPPASQTSQRSINASIPPRDRGHQGHHRSASRR